MELRQSLKTALKGLRANRARSMLTILGIVIGITAIILVMSVSAGARDLVLSQIQGLGAQMIIVEPGREPKGPQDFAEIFTDSLKRREVEAFLDPVNVKGIKYLSPNVIANASVGYLGETKRTQILGTAPAFKDIFELKLEAGRFYSEEEEKFKTSVAVIGARAKEELFGLAEAVNKQVKVKNRNFKIIGVLTKRGQTGIFNFDELLFVPVGTAQEYLAGISYYNSIIIRAETRASTDEMVEDLQITLRRLHNITDPQKDDFHVMTSEEIIERIGVISSILSALLTSVAAISLLVGGVGIMNIMLVSVTERTREIGLRKAVGATNRNILVQFLLEAVLLTAIGGILGIIFGSLLSFAASLILSRVLNIDWVFTFPIFGAMLGLLVSGAVGLVFGLFPARKASLKNPIEALRYE